MATPTILDFYRFAAPRGVPIKKFAAWTTTSSPSIVVTAATGKIYFVQGSSIFMEGCTDLGANSMTITHSADEFGGVKSSTITYSSVASILAGFGPGTERIVASNYFGFILFEVPVRLDAGETLTIAHSGGAGGITDGHIKFGITGWAIDSGDL